LRRIHIAESVLGVGSTQQQNNTATIVEEEESYTKSTTGYCDDTEYMKLLGINWDSDQDEFLFNFSELTQYAKLLPPSKRSLLKFTAKIFDPLGLLSPLVIRLKLLFRLLCNGFYAWHEPLEGKTLKCGEV